MGPGLVSVLYKPHSILSKGVNFFSNALCLACVHVININMQYSPGKIQKTSQFGRKMPQSQIADHPSAPQGRDTDHRHNYSKATSFLFRSKMITKLEGTPKPHHERRTKYNPHTLWEQQQQQQKYNVLLFKTRKESAALNGYQPR